MSDSFEFFDDRRMENVADHFTQKHTGRKFSELSDEDRELLGEYVRLSPIHLELNADAARGISSAVRLCYRLLKVVSQHEEIMQELPPDTMLLGVMMADTTDDVDRTLASMTRQGKLLLIQSCDALKKGTLQADVAALKALVPPLGLSREDDDA